MFSAAQGFWVFGLLQLAPVDDIHRAFGPHHGDFRGGVGQVHVRAEVLGGHHAISPAVSLARDEVILGTVASA
jgi:hypothetical protein